MDDTSLGTLIGVAIFLVILSAYFSGSETAMMALNRYRLRHLVNDGHGGAKKAARLLERPDQLLSIILIGNNLVNFTAASIVTVIAISLFGDAGVALAPVVCTLVFLIFAEVAPKTIAASYPEKIALPSSYILQALLWVGFPFVWLVNATSNGLIRLLGMGAPPGDDDELSHEELRTVVYERARIQARPQNMLLSILDLEKVTVDDIMVPRNEIVGIDLHDDVDEIKRMLRSAQHTLLPVFNDDIDKVIGILHMRNAAKWLTSSELTKAGLLQETEEPYFVPENTPLQTQLFNFQKQRERIALVVDEYGDIQGIVTIEDILEEIVGEFTTDLANTNIDIHPQEDGSFLIDGTANVRLLNRTLDWELPIDGPKTLNGLITEHLQSIPDSNVCIALDRYRIEVVQIQDNMIRTAKVSREEDPF